MGQVDSISAIKNRPSDYPLAGSKNYLLDMDDENKNEEVDSLDDWHNAQQKVTALPNGDSITSAAKQASVVEAEPKETAKAGFSFDTIIDWGKQAWEWICGLFTSKKEAEPMAAKATDAGIQPVSSTPALQAPDQINKRELDKMLQELQEQAKRIEESSNEVKDQNLQDEKRFIVYYMVQYQIRKDGILNIQFQFIFNQQKDREIRKEFSDLKALNIDLEKDKKVWGTVGTVATVVAVAAMVVAAVLSFFLTFGASGILAAVGAAVGTGAKVIGVAAGGVAGVATIGKAELDWKSGENRGKIDIANHKHKSLNELLRIESSTSSSEFSKALEISVLLKQMNDNLYKTMRLVSK